VKLGVWTVKDYNGFSSHQRQRAQNWLNKEWDAGRLPRPSNCVACGQTEGKIEAHAEDYGEPFRPGVTDAFHLCQKCHRKVHARPRNEGAWREYRAKIEAAHPGRQPLLEIELSRDEAAKRLAREAS
jgi:hypothetical protein